MIEAPKIEWNDLRSGGYYKIDWRDEERNIPAEEYNLDPFNVFKLQSQTRDFDKAHGLEPKEYESYTFESLTVFDHDPGIKEIEIVKTDVKEIHQLSHDDLIFAIIEVWLEKQENVNKPLLFARITNEQGEDYFQLHFMAIYDDMIQIFAFMSKFFTKTYEILPSSAIENAIMIEIPLICDNYNQN